MWRLYIRKNDELLEINGINDQGFVFENNNPLDWSFGRSNKTFSINIPNIAGNNLALGNLWNRGRDFELDFDAVLSADTLQMNGKLQIFEFNKKGARGQFISSNLANFKATTDKNLKDLDWDELEHTLTPLTVTSSFNGTGLFGGTLVYDWLDRGTGHYWDSQANEENWGRTMGLHETQGAIRVKNIIEKIFTGYALDWKIGDSTYMDFVNDLYMLHTGNQTRNSVGWKDRYFTIAGIDERSRTMNVTRTMDDTPEPLPGGGFGPPNPGTPIIAYIGEYDARTGEMSNFLESIGEAGQFPVRRYIIPESGSYRVTFDTNFNIKFTCTLGGNPKIIDWLDPELKLVIQQKLAGGSWTTFRTDTLISGTSTETGSEQQFLWTDIETQLVEILDTTFLESTIDTEWRAYAEFKITPRPEAGSLGSQDYNFAIEIDYLEGVKHQNRFKIETWDAPTLNSIVPGNWWVPNMNTGDFLKSFLLLVNAELFINDELGKAIIRNRFTDKPDIYDITNRIIEGSENYTPFNRDWNLEYQWTIDGNDKWCKSIHPTESPYLKRIETGSNDEKVVKHPFSYTENVTKDGQTYLRLWNDLENPTFSLDFNPRYMLYGGLETLLGNIKTYMTTTSINYAIASIPTFYTESGRSLKWDAPATSTLYDAFHEKNTIRIVQGGTLEIDIILDTNWLNQLYYIEDKSMESNFRIKIPGYWGYYQVIKLTYRMGNIWKATCMRLPDEALNDGPGTVGDFNNDFNNDF